jgi:hypothetical protein
LQSFCGKDFAKKSGKDFAKRVEKMMQKDLKQKKSRKNLEKTFYGKK